MSFLDEEEEEFRCFYEKYKDLIDNFSLGVIRFYKFKKDYKFVYGRNFQMFLKGLYYFRKQVKKVVLNFVYKEDLFINMGNFLYI